MFAPSCRHCPLDGIKKMLCRLQWPENSRFGIAHVPGLSTIRARENFKISPEVLTLANASRKLKTGDGQFEKIIAFRIDHIIRFLIEAIPLQQKNRMCRRPMR